MAKTLTKKKQSRKTGTRSNGAGKKPAARRKPQPRAASGQDMPRGNAIIGQSGGPTAVINQSLVGAVLEARKHRQIEKIYGARHGVKGILEEDFIDLSRISKAQLERVSTTPSAALGSVRMKPTKDDCAAMFRIMQKNNIHYFFYTGGNDSAETAYILHQMAEEHDYPLCVYHIPKTIDNDLRETDHCPGYGSAAKYVAQAFMSLDLDNRSLPGVIIAVVMGRHAGFLTAAATLGRGYPDSGPHLVYVPERVFDLDRFVKDVKACLKKYGRCVIAVSEGIHDGSGEAIAAKLTTEVDQFGNKQLSGTGGLGDHLASYLKQHLPKGQRVRAETLGYLQRSFVGVVSETDAAEARRAGAETVKLAARGIDSGSISIVREPGQRYRVKYKHTPLEKVARVTRELPKVFINKAGNDITASFQRYAQPLVGKLPKVELLNAKKKR